MLELLKSGGEIDVSASAEIRSTNEGAIMNRNWMSLTVCCGLLALAVLGCSGNQPQLNADGVDETDPAVAIEGLDADAPKKYQSKK
jgi:hypothetical protein